MSMLAIDWGSVGQWFSGVVATFALLYVLLREQFLERRNRPNLILGFAMTTVYVDQRYTRPENGRVDEGFSRWVRIQVWNDRRRKYAKNCRAYLVSYRVTRPDGTVVDESRHDVRQLQWMHGNYQSEARDLLPGVVHQIDL